MFKDVEGAFLSPELRQVFAAIGVGDDSYRVSCGVYDGCGFNFHNQVDMRTWESFVDHAGVPCYGVADSIEQFMGFFAGQIALDPRGCAVGFTTVTKAEQPPEGGWRWHKWGAYVGNQKPQCEYLYDEKEIESVVTFHVLWEKL